MTHATTAALVGATGGAGTTRLSLETAALLAGEGADVVVFDAAFATQGLGDALDGSLDPDLTSVLTEQATLDEAAVDLPVTSADAGTADDETPVEPGAVTCYPTAAPFTRLAEAKTAAAARRFETLLSDATDGVDYVLCDTPPVAANQSVSAVTAVDRVGVVAPASTRGADGVARTAARLADLGVERDLVVANEGVTPGAAADAVDADVTVPAAEPTTLADAPTVTADESSLTPAVAALARRLLDADVTVPDEEPDGRLAAVLDR
jgi:MinD-like ATPase involved in chromosome partitioning or flagellar assembly